MIGRVLACDELAEVKTQAAVAALKKALNEDAFFGVRCAAARALRKIRTEEAVAALLDSVKQDDARVRKHVVEELGYCYRDEAAQATAGDDRVGKEPGDRGDGAPRAWRVIKARTASAAAKKALRDESWGGEPVGAAFGVIRDLNDPALADAVMETIKSRETTLDPRDVSEAMVDRGEAVAARQAEGDGVQVLRRVPQSPAADDAGVGDSRAGRTAPPRGAAAADADCGEQDRRGRWPRRRRRRWANSTRRRRSCRRRWAICGRRFASCRSRRRSCRRRWRSWKGRRRLPARSRRRRRTRRSEHPFWMRRTMNADDRGSGGLSRMREGCCIAFDLICVNPFNPRKSASYSLSAWPPV